MSTALALRDPRSRAYAVLRRHGWDTVSFQGLESGFQYWFDEDAVVAYVDTGGAWVAGGGPIAAPDERHEVARRFAQAAREAGRRACFFATEAPGDLPAMQIGEQPVWDAARWDETLAGAASLRYQLRRARGKGVTVRRVATLDAATSEAMQALATAWQATHAMPPMRFLVQLEHVAEDFAGERVLIVAERAGLVVGFASAVPVYARQRLFVEDLVRAPDAPNGTVELLVDAVLRAAPALGFPEVTLGLAPLAGGVARWLRIARWLGTPLYDFAGLRAFKGKLRPRAWEPVYLCAAPGGSRLVALRDSLRAFAGGSLVGFAGRTLFRRR